MNKKQTDPSHTQCQLNIHIFLSYRKPISIEINLKELCPEAHKHPKAAFLAYGIFNNQTSVGML